MPEEMDTMFHHLQDAGYYIAHVGEANQKAWKVVDEGGDIREYREHVKPRGFDYVHQTMDPWRSRAVDSHVTEYWADQGLLDEVRADLRERMDHAQSFDHWRKVGSR